MGLASSIVVGCYQMGGVRSRGVQAEGVLGVGNL